MNLDTELAYILAFARERSFDGDEVEMKQLVALWTAFCLHQNLDCDTSLYDQYLTQVWNAVIQGLGGEERTDEFLRTYKAFDLCMGELLC